MKATHYLAGLLLACLTLEALGQTVSRCEDDEGHLTFTTLQCPPGTHHSLHRAYHPLLTSDTERTAVREREERRRQDQELRKMSEE